LGDNFLAVNITVLGIRNVNFVVNLITPLEETAMRWPLHIYGWSGISRCNLDGRNRLFAKLISHSERCCVCASINICVLDDLFATHYWAAVTEIPRHGEIRTIWMPRI